MLINFNHKRVINKTQPKSVGSEKIRDYFKNFLKQMIKKLRLLQNNQQIKRLNMTKIKKMTNKTLVNYFLKKTQRMDSFQMSND